MAAHFFSSRGLRSSAWKAVSAVGLILALTGCGVLAVSIPVGDTSAEARSHAGSPSEITTLPNGSQVWFYENPLSFFTYRVEFDPGGRVISNRQVLTEANFVATLIPKVTTLEQVHLALGRPESFSRFPNLGEQVWTYRYLEVTLEMLVDVHIDLQTGIVTGYNWYRDPAYVSMQGV